MFLLCFVTGNLAWSAGIPSRWLFAIWPPAGLALAGVCVWGWRAVPGIYAAIALSLFLQSQSYHGPKYSTGYYVLSAAIFAGVSLLQAVIAGVLLRKTCGAMPRLIEPRTIFRFLLIAGPGQALISALLVPPLIMALGRWHGENYFFYAFDNFINELLGGAAFSVILFALVSTGDPVWRPRRFTVALPVLAAVVFFSLLDDVSPDTRMQFSNLAHRVIELIAAGFLLLLILLLLLVTGHAATVRAEAAGVTEDLFNETSARLLAQTSLATSEARLAEAQHIARIGSWVWDPAQVDAVWSDELFRLLGFKPRCFVPTHDRFFESVHPEDRPLVERRMKAAIANEQPYDFDFRIVRPDGAVRIIHAEALIDRDAAGKPIRWRGTDQDVTDRVRVEEDRRRLDDRLRVTQRWESLGQLAGGVAHDFNNLMSGVLGYATLAREQLPAESPTQDLLKPIEEAALHAASLCQQLLTYAGKGISARGTIALADLLAESADLIRLAIPKTVELRLGTAADLPIIEGDRSQIKQVLLNLVGNAADAIGPAGGVIEIHAGSCRGGGCPVQSPGHFCTTLPLRNYVWLEVCDTGCGIADDALARIFDPFFTTKEVGRGLGLSAVAGIVRGHGGVICVTSLPGIGTSLRVYLAAVDDGPSPSVINTLPTIND